MKYFLLSLAAILFFVTACIAQNGVKLEMDVEIVGCPIPPLSPVVTHDTVCVGQSATLTATGPAGSTIKWYDSPTGGMPVFTGSIFSTPPLFNSQTWYVEVEQCHSFALQFPQNNDKVDCGNPPGNLFGLLGDGTIEAWVKNVPGEVIGKDQGPGNNVPKWFFGVYNGGMDFHINGPGYGGGFWIYSSGFTPPSGWYHVAMVKAGNSISFFYNGNPVGGGILPQPVVPNNAPLTIGWGEPCCQASGIIDEVRFYNLARSQSEIAASLNQCADPIGLIAYYPMNDVPGQSTVADYSGGGHHGTLVNMNLNTAWVDGYPLCCFPSCVGTSTRIPVIATVFPYPTATLTGSGVLCTQGNNDPVYLNVSFTGAAPWLFVYSVNGAQQAPITTSTNSYALAIATPGAIQLVSVNSIPGNCPGTVSGSVNIPLIAISATTQPAHPNCFGSSDGSIMLDVSGGASPYTFQWSNGNTDQNPIGLPAGAYMVTVTDANGCIQTTSYTLNNPPQLVAAVTYVQHVDCTHPTGSINTSVNGGTPGYTYQWSPSGSGPNPIGLAAGNYNGTVTDANGCTVTISTIVPSNLTPPSATASATGMLSCTVNTLVLSGAGSSTGGNFTYQWTGPGIVSGGNTLAPVINQPGIYTLMVTNTTNGCQSSSFVSVTQDITIPFIVIQPPEEINCITPQITLDATGSNNLENLSYSWSTTNGNIVSGADTPSPVVSTGGTYELTILDTTNYCFTTGQVTVQANADLPTIDLAMPQGLNCTVTQVQLGATIGNGSNLTFDWSSSDGNFASGQNSLQPTVDAPGTYQIEVTNPATGCQSLGQVMVVQDIQTPLSDAGPAGLLTCVVTELQLDGTGSDSGPGLAYLWTTTDGNIVSGENTTTLDIDEPGTYILTVANTINTCVSSDTVIVIQDINEPVAAAADPALIGCLTPVITLDATASSSGTQIAYEWTTADGHILSGVNTLLPEVDAPGSYTLTVLDTQNGCFSFIEMTVVQNTVLPSLDAGPGMELTCLITEYMLQAAAFGQTNNFEYEWITLAGDIINGGQTLTPLVGGPGTYTLTVMDTVNGCSSSASVVITEDVNIPQAEVAPSNQLNCYFSTAILDGTGSSQGPNLEYTWSTLNGSFVSGTGSLTPVINMPGLYTLTIIDTVNACVASQTALIEADTAAPILTIAVPDILNCYNPVISLDATAEGLAGITLVWSTVDGNFTGNENTLSPLVDQPGIYSLEVTNSLNGCSTTMQTQVNSDFAIPISDAGPDGVINCTDTMLVLSGTGDGGGAPLSWLWTTTNGILTSGSETPNPTVTVGGTYFLTVTNLDNGCSGNSSMQVEEDLIHPIADAGQQGLLNCYQPQIQLDGSGSSSGGQFTYLWTTTDGSISSGETSSAPLVNGPGTYQLSVTDNLNHCISTAAVLVTGDFAAPQAEAGPTALLTCSLTNLALNGSGDSGPNFIYSWTTPNGNILSGANTLTPGIDAPGLYQLQITNLDNGCSADDAVQINQDITSPLAVATAPGLLTCAVTTLTLSGSGSSTGANFNYNWTTLNGNILSGPGTLSPVVDAPGLYNLTVLDNFNGCSTFTSTIVLENVEIPSGDAGVASDLTCTVTSINLSGTVSGSPVDLVFNWTTADGNILSGANTLTPLVNEPGTYVITFFDQTNGCSSTEEVIIGQNITPPVVVVANPAVLTCAQEEVVLNATGSNSGGIYGLVWTTASGNIVSGEQTITPTANEPGVYTLTITNGVNGCVSSASVQVTQDIVQPGVDAGEDFTLPCFEEMAFLEGSASATTTNLQYAWTTADGQITSGGNTLTPGVTTGGAYLLTVTNLVNGCQNADQVLVIQYIPADPTFVPVQPPCHGDKGQIEILEVTGGTPPFLYSINGGLTFQSSPRFPNLGSAVYTILIQDALGCETTPAVQPIIEPDPLLVGIDASIELLQGDSYQLQTEVNLLESEIQLITWTPPTGLSCTDCLDPVATPLNTLVYKVEVLDQDGCLGTASVQFFVDERPLIYMPNIFSPNGDGENDVFYIFARDENILEIRSFLIFNRWGELVCEYYHFQPNNPANGWSGVHRGQPVNPSVFVWFAEIEFIDGRVELFKGDVTVVK